MLGAFIKENRQMVGKKENMHMYHSSLGAADDSS